MQRILYEMKEVVCTGHHLCGNTEMLKIELDSSHQANVKST